VGGRPFSSYRKGKILVKKNFIDLFKEWKENFTGTQVIFSQVKQTWNLGRKRKINEFSN